MGNVTVTSQVPDVRTYPLEANSTALAKQPEVDTFLPFLQNRTVNITSSQNQTMVQNYTVEIIEPPARVSNVDLG